MKVILTEEKEEIVLKFLSISHKIEDTERIFKAYERENDVRGGFGLGLEIVYTICKKENVKLLLNTSVHDYKKYSAIQFSDGIHLNSKELEYYFPEDFDRQLLVSTSTHNQDEISIANKICVMDSGKMIDIGNHSELIKRSESYRELVNKRK